MKRIFLITCLTVFLFTYINATASRWTGIQSENPSKATSTLVSSDVNQSVIRFDVSGFYANQVLTPQGMQTVIRVPGGSSMLLAGAPDLPKLAASIIIPDDAAMKVEVIHTTFRDYPGYSIAPSRGKLYRNVSPETVPYWYDQSYTKDAFFPETEVSLHDPYILRDYRGQTVVVYPFRFNPVTGVLRVYTEITVKVSRDLSGIQAKNSFKRQTALKPAKEFNSIYQQQFKNPPSVQYTTLPEEGTMLIIADASFMSSMEPFLEWKRKRGMQVEMVDMATVGTTEVDIKNYVSTYYNTNGLTFLLLVGDYQQIPSPMSSYAQTGGASDPSYGYITGADSYAEVLVGRFSAQSASDVETQVQRVLNYEMSPIAGAAFYGKGVCVASDQGPGDDNEYDWEHERNIRADLLGFTYSDVDELYDGSHGGMDASGDPSNVDLANVFQNGVSIMSYTGHGSMTSCGTTGFSTTDVAALTNYNMLPFIWSVACVNGDFTNGTCLAEALLTAQSGGQPTGAIATFMSSINQSWDPPMDGQDEMVDLLVGASANQSMRTFGGLSVNGCMHMNDQYLAAGAEMTDTWHCFGDPSLLVRTAPPAPMVVTHIPVVSVGTTQLTVNGNTDSAIVSLTLNGNILATGMVLNGAVMLNFPALPSIDTLDVVVTAFNKVPYIGTVRITGTTGIEDPANSDVIMDIYPNPVLASATLSFEIEKSGHGQVSIYDVEGRKVLEVANQIFSSGQQKLSFNTLTLDAGVYSVLIQTDHLVSRKLFQVTR